MGDQEDFKVKQLKTKGKMAKKKVVTMHRL
jgi:hypothetical protein